MNKTELFISKLENKFELIGEYKNSKTKVKLKHKECENIFEIYPDNFIQGGKKCKFCHKEEMKKKYSKTTEEFKQDILRLEGHEYECLSEYKNCHTKVLMKHNKCGKTYEVCPTDFLSGYRCPKCKHSLGEKKIQEFLEKYNFNFETQQILDGCFYIKPLKFDFQVFINDNKFILIEFDGIQHFKKCWYDTEEDFKIRQLRDKIKNKFCKKKNLKLIRINYKQLDDIPKILTETFRDYRNLNTK